MPKTLSAADISYTDIVDTDIKRLPVINYPDFEINFRRLSLIALANIKFEINTRVYAKRQNESGADAVLTQDDLADIDNEFAIRRLAGSILDDEGNPAFSVEQLGNMVDENLFDMLLLTVNAEYGKRQLADKKKSKTVPSSDSSCDSAKADGSASSNSASNTAQTN